MYLILEEVKQKYVNAIAYAKGLRIAPKTDAEGERGKRAVFVERKMTDLRSEAEGKLQAGVIPGGD